MGVTLFVIMGSALIALACFTRSLYLELKDTRDKLEKTRTIMNTFYNELQATRKKLDNLQRGQKKEQNPPKEKIPSFLLADDPMEALLKDVGKVSK